MQHGIYIRQHEVQGGTYDNHKKFLQYIQYKYKIINGNNNLYQPKDARYCCEFLVEL